MLSFRTSDYMNIEQDEHTKEHAKPVKSWWCADNMRRCSCTFEHTKQTLFFLSFIGSHLLKSIQSNDEVEDVSWVVATAAKSYFVYLFCWQSFALRVAATVADDDVHLPVYTIEYIRAKV